MPKANAAAGTTVTPAPAVVGGTDVQKADFASEMFADAASTPEFRRDDLSIPFVRIAQAGTPQRKRAEPVYIEGLEEGDFFHVVTRRVWKGQSGLLFLPVFYDKRHIEWKTREDGGGFVADHGYNPDMLTTCTRDDKNRDRLPNGNHLSTTALYYGLVLTLDENNAVVETTEAVLSLASTMLKSSRQWNTMMRATTVRDPATGERRPAQPYYRAYRLTTNPEKNDKGTWFGLRVEAGPTVEELMNGPTIYRGGKHLAGLISSGERKTDFSQMADDAEVVEGSTENPDSF